MKRFFVIFAVLILVSLTGCTVETVTPEKESQEEVKPIEIYEEGIQQFESGNYEKAIEFLEKIASNDPKYTDAQNKIKEINLLYSAENYAEGIKQFEIENYEKALSFLEKVIDSDPNYIDAETKITKINHIKADICLKAAKEYLSDNNFIRAKSEANKALNYNPELTEAQKLLLQIDSKEQAYIQAKKEKEIADYKASCKTYEFRVLKKDADSLKGERIKLKGEVLQILEQSGSADIRLAVTRTSYGWSYNDVVYVVYLGTTDIYEEDVITVWGEVSGSYTYESIAGYNITLPLVRAKYLQ